MRRLLRNTGKGIRDIDHGAIMGAVIAVALWYVASPHQNNDLGTLIIYIVIGMIVAVVGQKVVGSILIWLSKIGLPPTIGLTIDTGRTTPPLHVPMFGKGRVTLAITNNDPDYRLTECYATLAGIFHTTPDKLLMGTESGNVSAVSTAWNGKKLLWSNPAPTGTLDIASRSTEILRPIEVGTSYFCFLFAGNTDQSECDSSDTGFPAGCYLITIQIHGELDGESQKSAWKFVVVFEGSTLTLCEYGEFKERQKPDWKKTRKGQAEALAQEKFHNGLMATIKRQIEEGTLGIDTQNEPNDKKDNS